MRAPKTRDLHEAPPLRDPAGPRTAPAVLLDYEDLASASARLDELTGVWDASAVLAAWTEPGDPLVNVVGTPAAEFLDLTGTVACAARDLLDAHRSAARWRALFPHDNFLRRETVHGVGACMRTDVVAVDFVTPRGGRGRLAVIGGAASLASIQMEAMFLALRLPAALARERAHEGRLRAALGGLRGGAVVIGADDDLRYANAAAQRSLGLEDELERTALGGLVHGQLLDLVTAARRAHGQVSGEFEGPHGPLAADVVPLSAERTGPLLVQLHDLAERRRVQRQQDEFIGTVGHELQTPLTSARTALELVHGGETGPLNDDQRNMVELAVRNLTRLEHLVHQLLDTARQRVGRLVLQRANCAVATVLDTVLENAHRSAQRSGRDFSAVIDPRAVAHVDEVRFGEIVENLVGNALKFTPAGGWVGVRVRADMPCPFEEIALVATELGIPTAGCEVEVRDDGPGMDPTTREHAFEAFYQEGDPLADRPRGAGLGLAIVRSLVEAHDGRVDLDSTPGRGTCVRVWVPARGELARAIAGVAALRTAAGDLLRREPQAQLELAPLDRADGADLGGLDRVDGNEILLVRIGDRHLARLSPGAGRGAVLPGARCARLGKDGARIGTTLARLAGELRSPRDPRGLGPARQEEPRA